MLPPESTGQGLSEAELSRARIESKVIDAVQFGAWLGWAATQIEASLAIDAESCNRVLASLAELLGAAEACAKAAPSTPRQAVERDMCAVIVAMQAHDRVTQGFVHVAQSLRSLHEYLRNTRSTGTAESWRLLCEKQLRAFSMAEERILFARMVAIETPDEAAADPPENAEMFFTELRPDQP